MLKNASRGGRTKRGVTMAAAGLLAASLGLMGVPAVAGASNASHHGAHHKSSLFNMLPAKVKSSGTIVDYIEPTYPPMEMVGKTGTGLTGVDVLLARAAAKVIGVKLHIVTVETFAELFPALTSGRAEMVWSGIFDSPTRFKLDTFADYFRTGSQLYIPTSEKHQFTKLSQFCGKTVAGETATLFEGNLKQYFKKICTGGQGLNFVNLSGVAQQNLAMQEGRAQVAVVGPEIVDYLQKTTPGKYQPIGPTIYPTYYGVVFPNNAFGKKLEHVVVLAIDKLIKDGKYQKILKQFGLQKQAVKKSTVDKGTTQPPKT